MILLLGDITIGVKEIPQYQDGRGGRSERERQVVNDLLEEMLGAPVQVDHHANGAPFLPQYPGLYISISHSLKQVAVALSSKPVGIDTETLRPQLERVKRKFLSEEEQARFVTIEDLLLAWCIKEAAYKIAGIEGLDFAHDIAIHTPQSVTVKGCDGVLTVDVVEHSAAGVTVVCHQPGQEP